MNYIRIAIQKSGRLSEKSIELLQNSGINFSISDRKLVAEAKNFPAEILFLRDDDIPQYVEQGVADIGILGLNEVLEKNKDVNIVEELGFSSCKMSLAIPKDEKYIGIKYFQDKRIATSYPTILTDFLTRNNITASIEEITGSVEIATGIGLADCIFDIVSSGSTLITNGLKEVEVVLKSQAVLISNPNLNETKQSIIDKLLFRINAVRNAKEFKYIVLNTPNSKIEEIKQILPGMKSPSIFPLANEGWSSLHSVIQEDKFWEIIDKLKEIGAEGILVMPIEKMIS